jgi:hypothetical protein
VGYDAAVKGVSVVVVHRENEEEEEEYRENDKQALFVNISWNEFGDSNLGVAASE